MAKLVKTIDVPIYGSRVIISLDAPALAKYMSKIYKTEHIIQDCNAGQATAFLSEEGGYIIHSLYISKELYRPEYLTHECVHCAWHILDEVGVGVSADNHEALAYLAGWLSSEVDKFYRTGK